MKFLKMTGLLIVLSMLAVGCSSDDDDAIKGGEPAELYVYVRDASDDYLLQGVEVQFMQNNRELCTDETDDYGLALCGSEWDGLVSGPVTVNISVEGYKAFSKTAAIVPGQNEWTVLLEPDNSAKTAVTITGESVEDFYGVLVIDMGKDVASVRVSEGTKYDANAFEEYRNSSLGIAGMTQRITYTNLLPETKYSFTVVSFDKNKKQLETKSYSFTTKGIYNRSTVTTNIADYLTISNGISVTLQSQPSYGFYIACYEKNEVPANDIQVIKEALAGSSIIKDAKIGYVYGLKPGTEYRIYVIPMESKYILDSNYYYAAPGKVSYLDLKTKNATSNARANVIKSNSTKNDFEYYIKSSKYSSNTTNPGETYCMSCRGVEVSEYDAMESEPDIAWATVCQSMGLNTFDSYGTTSAKYWSGLNLTTWYAVVTLAYSDKGGTVNSGVVTRYKFKYGSYGVTARSAKAVAPVSSSDIKYGAVTNEMLGSIKELR